MHKNHIYKSEDVVGTSVILATSRELKAIKLIRAGIHDYLCPIISINSASHYELRLKITLNLSVVKDADYETEEEPKAEDKKGIENGDS